MRRGYREYHLVTRPNKTAYGSHPLYTFSPLANMALGSVQVPGARFRVHRMSYRWAVTSEVTPTTNHSGDAWYRVLLVMDQQPADSATPGDNADSTGILRSLFRTGAEDDTYYEDQGPATLFQSHAVPDRFVVLHDELRKIPLGAPSSTLISTDFGRIEQEFDFDVICKPGSSTPCTYAYATVTSPTSNSVMSIAPYLLFMFGSSSITYANPDLPTLDFSVRVESSIKYTA